MFDLFLLGILRIFEISRGSISKHLNRANTHTQQIKERNERKNQTHIEKNIILYDGDVQEYPQLHVFIFFWFFFLFRLPNFLFILSLLLVWFFSLSFSFSSSFSSSCWFFLLVFWFFAFVFVAKIAVAFRLVIVIVNAIKCYSSVSCTNIAYINIFPMFCRMKCNLYPYFHFAFRYKFIYYYFSICITYCTIILYWERQKARYERFRQTTAEVTFTENKAKSE